MKAEGKGTIIFIDNTNQVTDSFRKREFAVETSEENNGKVYTQSINFQVVQDKCDVLNEFSVGDEVNVNFNIAGRPWKNKEGVTKYFNSLNAWKIEKLGSSNTSAPTNEETPEDLPF